jgi:outer membrane protein W
MRVSLLAAAVLAGSPLAASGQIVDVSLNAFATWWDTDDFGDAYGGQIGLEIAFIDWFSAEARTGYLRAEHHDLNIVPLELVGTFRLSLLDVIEPYAGAGVGRYFLSSDEISTKDREALFPLIGMDVHLPTTKLTLFAEARWMIFTDSVSSDITNADLDGLAFSAGVSWSF